MDDFRGTTAQIPDFFGKLVYRHFSRIADVDRLMVVALRQFKDAVDQIRDEAEAPRLRAITKHRQRFILKGLRGKSRDHPAVIGSHAGPVGVKDSNNMGVDPMVAVIGHDHGFSEAFGFVVHATRTHGIHIAPIVFRLRMDQRIAVTFRGRRLNIGGALSPGQTQGLMSPERTHFQGLNGQFKVINRACRRGKVKDVIDAPRQVEVLGYILLDEAEVLIPCKMFNIGNIPCNQVVHADDLVAFSQKSITQMGAEKARAAGNEGDWGFSLFRHSSSPCKIRLVRCAHFHNGCRKYS